MPDEISFVLFELTNKDLFGVGDLEHLIIIVNHEKRV